MSKPKALTDEQKAHIKADFREWSGGYHPGEAGEEHEKYVEEWAERYGHDELDLFLTQWGEEELAKEAEEAKRADARKAREFRKRMQKLAASFVKMNDAKTAVIISVEDLGKPDSGVVLKLPDRKDKTEAKAEWADVAWMIQLLLERGAREAEEQ